MSKPNLAVHPYSRLAAAIFAIAGTVVTDNLYQLLTGWVVCIVPISIAAKIIKRHLSFLLYAVIPILIMLLVIYAFILPTFQSGQGFYNSIKGIEFTLSTVLKLILFTSILQLLLQIPNDELFTTLKCWGIKGDGLVIYFGALTIWADVKMKANKIVDARFARGLIKNRSFFNRLKQIPFVVRPLITGILVSAVERSQSWRQERILSRLENLKASNIQYSLNINSLLLLASLLWLITSAYLKYK